MNASDSNAQIANQIADLETRFKALSIRYEQYFAGVEKRAPIREQEDMARELLRISQRRIIHTELRYKFQNLSSRFHVYQGMWERLQRQMDEGRSERLKTQTTTVSSADKAQTEVERVYQDYSNISRQCQAKTPSRAQLEKFIEQQRENIKTKYGNVQCQFKVICENGNPKIKVSLKK
jgi:hypothetical protein